jgi:FkbM family methyltransferase
MNFSVFTPGKLQWLFSHDVARKHPFRTVWRLINWELIRILNRTVESRYDETFHITLVPHEGASRLAYYFGVSEPELFAFYEGFLKPGMTVVDAGANIGLHTLFFAKRVGPEGRVYAFEPGQSAFGRLQSHVERNQLANVRCFHCALGASEGVVAITENCQDNSRNFVVESSSGTNGTKNVGLRSLDQVLKKEGVGRVDFLKIDVEGFEPQVLEGASNYLRQQSIRVLQLELDDSSLARSGYTAARVSNMLDDAGYRCAEWSCQSRSFRPADKTSFNTFFVAETELLQ